jgi:hypothetical protein
MRMTAALHLGRVAHHEVGHALVALHFAELEFEVEGITLTSVGKGRYTGVTGLNTPEWEDSREVADALVTVYTAGAVAAHRYLAEAGIRNARWWAERSAWHDEQAFDHIARYSSLTWDAATAAAERILTSSWVRTASAAERLAAGLRLPVHLI